MKTAETRYYLTVRDLEEYFFCPRMFYLHVVRGIEIPKGFWCEIGKEYEKIAKTFVEKTFKEVIKGFELESKNLKLKGRPDFIVEGMKPLEIKCSSSLKPWWKYTLIAYALLIEDAFNRPVKQGFLLLLPEYKVIEVNIFDEDRKFVINSIKKCFEILGREIFPKGNKLNCNSCDFKTLCY